MWFVGESEAVGIMDGLLAGASEEELIALAIAASLSECPGGGGASSPCPADLFSHADAAGGTATAGAPGVGEGAAWISLGSSPGTAARLSAGGAWGKGAPRTSSSSRAAAEGAAPPPQPPAAGRAAGGEDAGEGTGEPSTPAKGDDSQQYAEYIGTGHDECANEDEAILGVPLTEIAAGRVVRFSIPLQGSSPSGAHAGADRPPCHGETGTPSRDPGPGMTSDPAGGRESPQPPAGGRPSAHAADDATAAGAGGACEGGGRRVVHGYDAVALARWLLRDERLPLTSHRVSPQDVGRVWEVFFASATVEEVSELEGAGELVRASVIPPSPPLSPCVQA